MSIAIMEHVDILVHVGRGTVPAVRRVPSRFSPMATTLYVRTGIRSNSLRQLLGRRRDDDAGQVDPRHGQFAPRSDAGRP